DHALRPEVGERTFDRAAVLQRALHEREAGFGQQPVQARLLQRGVVVVVEVVVAEDFIPALDQAMAQVGTDEAGGAGNEYAHSCFSHFVQRQPSTRSRGSARLTSNRTASGLPKAR